MVLKGFARKTSLVLFHGPWSLPAGLNANLLICFPPSTVLTEYRKIPKISPSIYKPFQI